MCTNFEPYLEEDFGEQFGANPPRAKYRDHAFIEHEAPILRSIVRKNESDPTGREAISARFGLVPFWFKRKPHETWPTWATHNARDDKIAKLASFRDPWKNRQFCLIPVSAFYEPCYLTGKNVWTRISLKGGEPFALAGIWEEWRNGEEIVISFSMITISGEGHAIMKDMHKPYEEKRMPVILLPDSYDRWLNATTADAAAMLLPFPAELMKTEDSVRHPRAGAARKTATP